MFDFVFSCTTISTVAGNSALLPVWSKCVWVLMIVVIGFGVTARICSRIVGPYPVSFVSTIATPFSMMNTPVLPPVNAGPTADDPMM